MPCPEMGAVSVMNDHPEGETQMGRTRTHGEEDGFWIREAAGRATGVEALGQLTSTFPVLLGAPQWALGRAFVPRKETGSQLEAGVREVRGWGHVVLGQVGTRKPFSFGVSLNHVHLPSAGRHAGWVGRPCQPRERKSNCAGAEFTQ